MPSTKDKVVFLRERTYTDLFLFLFLAHGILKYIFYDIETKDNIISYNKVFLLRDEYNIEIPTLKGVPILLSDVKLINEVLGSKFFKNRIRYNRCNYREFGRYKDFKDFISSPQ